MEFRDPPPVSNSGGNRGRRRYKYSEEAKELRKRPGEWAVLKESSLEDYSAASSLAVHIRKGHFPSFPAGDFEARVRTEGDQVCVYCRYVGAL